MPSPVHPVYPLRTERLTLRPVTMGDLDAINAYRSNPTVALYLPHEPHSHEDTVALLTKMTEQSALATPGQWLDLAVEFDSAGLDDARLDDAGLDDAGLDGAGLDGAGSGSRSVVGEVVLKWDAHDEQQGEIGFAFHPSVAGTGVATEATIAVLHLAFERFGWHRVIGICDILNLRSSALMERVGMRREAVFRESEWFKGRWATMCHYAVLQHEWQARHADAAPPSAPIQPSV